MYRFTQISSLICVFNNVIFAVSSLTLAKNMANDASVVKKTDNGNVQKMRNTGLRAYISYDDDRNEEVVVPKVPKPPSDNYGKVLKNKGNGPILLGAFIADDDGKEMVVPNPPRPKPEDNDGTAQQRPKPEDNNGSGLYESLKCIVKGIASNISDGAQGVVDNVAVSLNSYDYIDNKTNFVLDNGKKRTIYNRKNGEEVGTWKIPKPSAWLG